MENININAITPEQAPEPMPVEEEAKPISRKRNSRSKIQQPITSTDIKDLQQEDREAKESQKLQESVDKVVGQMKKRLGLPEDLSSIVTQQQLDAWKLQYGDLYRTNLNNNSFIWHKVRRKDYIALMTDPEISAIENQELRIFFRQEKIMKQCVLYPDMETLENLIENNAGVAGNISDEIMMVSGFRPVSTEQIE